jgi:hypothetical protein
MRKIFLPICFSISLVPGLFAVDEKAATAALKTRPSQSSAPADAKNKPSDESNPIASKNKSSFQFDAGSRSPFWPIGWKPTARVAGGAGGGAIGDVPPGAFLVTSITLDGATRFAIINGKTMGEGQQFGLQVGTQIYQVILKRIEDGRVTLGRGEEEIVVPLRRKEASERPPDGASRSPSPSPNR